MIVLIKGTFFSGEGEIMKLQTVTISCIYDSIYNILLLLKIVGTFAKHDSFKLRLIQIGTSTMIFWFCFYVCTFLYEELTERETDYSG